MPASTAPRSSPRHGQGLSFPRRCRLKRSPTIRDIVRTPMGRRRTRPFRASWKVAQADAPACFAFVVSRRSGPAHQRNRIKRRLREAVRRNKSLWPQGVNVVITANADHAAKQGFDELCGQVEKVLLSIRTGTTDSEPGRNR